MSRKIVVEARSWSMDTTPYSYARETKIEV